MRATWLHSTPRSFRVQPELVVIDPISAYLGKTDSYKDAEVRGLLAPLLSLIAKHQTGLLTVAHLSKDAQRAALHRPGGSVAFVAAARLVFAVATDPSDETRRIMAPLKANICAPAACLAFRLPDGRIEWDGSPVSVDAETLLRPAAPHGREERSDAEAFLKELLADDTLWPLDAKVALEDGKAHGIPERTLQGARCRLGISSRKRGFGRGAPWFWYRPGDEAGPPTEPAPVASIAPMASMQDRSVIGASTHIDAIGACTEEEDDDAAR